MLAQTGEPQFTQGGRCRKPTPGLKRVQSAERKDLRPDSCTPSRDNRCGCSPSTESQSRSCGAPAQCYRCKGYGYFTKECTSEVFNGLPVRTRDSFRDSSQDSRQAKDKTTPKPPLNEVEVAPKARMVTQSGERTVPILLTRAWLGNPVL